MTEPEQIAAWQRLDAETTTSGFLTEADLAALAAAGTRHVIDLAPAEHPRSLADEDRKLAVLGIGYSYLPVPFDRPEEAHFAAFCAALEAAPRPLHVHCIANWRVSAFFYRYNTRVRGMREEEARALMARQWDPALHDHPDAPAWAAFLGLERSPSG